MDWVAMARSRHIARALVIAAMLGAFLVWWKLVGDPGPVESVRDETGTVEEVHEKGLLVRLPTGQKVRVYRLGNPVVGATVHLTVTRYANGEELVTLINQGDL